VILFTYYWTDKRRRRQQRYYQYYESWRRFFVYLETENKWYFSTQMLDVWRLLTPKCLR